MYQLLNHPMNKQLAQCIPHLYPLTDIGFSNQWMHKYLLV